MMNEFRTAKEAYDQTPIPQELNERVQAGIARAVRPYRSAHRRVALRRTDHGRRLLCGGRGYAESLSHRGGGRGRRAGAGGSVPDPDGPQL